MIKKIKFAYKGWIGCAPVFIDDVHSDNPVVVARFMYTHLLLSLNISIFAGIAWLYDKLGVTHDGKHTIIVTGNVDVELEVNNS